LLKELADSELEAAEECEAEQQKVDDLDEQSEARP
jgi:hypothetical protein